MNFVSATIIAVCLFLVSDSTKKAEDFMSTAFIISAPCVPVFWACGVSSTWHLLLLMPVFMLGTCQKLKKGRPIIEL